MKNDYTIFYAWQSDISNKINRNFIRNALKKALKKINKKFEVEDSPRPLLSLDHDTKGVPGMPEIANTILQKIKSCGIFVADLTFISTSSRVDSSKKISNPNVVFELGYAFASIGPEKIICIMNEVYGKPNELFFDLVHRRWPITYFLENYDDPNRNKTLSELSDKIENAIIEIMKDYSSNSSKQNKIKKEKLFTKAREQDFEYTYNQLDQNIQINMRVSDSKNYNSYSEDINRKELLYTCSLLELLMLFVSKGYTRITYWKLDEFLTNYIKQNTEFTEFTSKEVYVNISNREYVVLLRTLGLTKIGSSNEDDFNNKIYKFKYWLEYNNLINGNINLRKI